MPKITTDRYALAVLIYTFLLNRHPLDGGKVWNIDDPQKDDDMRYGAKALFIEHPTDSTNRVKPNQLAPSQLPQGDPNRLPYTICGPYLKKLFDKAFIDGLHNPSMRPSAAEWEDALIKTCDLVQPCQNPDCQAHWYVSTILPSLTVRSVVENIKDSYQFLTFIMHLLMESSFRKTIA